ncbi:DHHA1 domain-containing protein [Bacillus sp. N1-1]|uniref:alanyl-tRNA editing protein n=1 Tax=Bacillus sp. N1-1 TaxID=2682541 RepID=UPI001317BF6A|nr:DHHA1 domain-containing protein [Bacillus sp. N1-1]QHA91336.1 alanyl-tRNA editing protein [Bacillus sp. N1-1]
MTTTKLYYKDPYITTFTAKKCEQLTDEENRSYVVLDQTAFYPTGGGQPCDTGTLNGVQVHDVEEVEGEVRHYVDGTLDDEQVKGEINWTRRFDHMQQHAGQHILSAAFEDQLGYSTVSFHLGQEVCTIDLDVAHLSEEDAEVAEEFANDVIQQNLPIETKWVNEEELARYSLRKQLAVSENIRLVMIPNVDYSGCGGTHPSSTGQVRAISILKSEKQKKQIRVHFVCGKRVTNELRTKQAVVLGLTNVLSVPESKLVDAAKRVLLQSKEHEKTIDELNEKLLSFEAKELLQAAEMIHDQKVVQMISSKYGMKDLQKLAKMVLKEDPEVVVFFVSEGDHKLQIVCGRGEKIDQDMNLALKKVLPFINGKGGGKKDFAQGGGEPIRSAEEVLIELVKATFQ